MIRSMVLGSVLVGSLPAAPVAGQEPDAVATSAACTARYGGDEPSTLPAGNAFQVVDTTFNPSWGGAPDRFTDAEDFSGGTSEGNVCFVVDSLVAFAEGDVTFDRDIRVWFAQDQEKLRCSAGLPSAGPSRSRSGSSFVAGGCRALL